MILDSEIHTRNCDMKTEGMMIVVVVVVVMMMMIHLKKAHFCKNYYFPT
jgi:hypothetical protein